MYEYLIAKTKHVEIALENICTLIFQKPKEKNDYKKPP